MIVVGTLSYLLMGILCIIVGAKTRRGIGNYRISRTVHVRYAELPLKERIRTSNTLLVFGFSLLACATFTQIPVFVMVIFFLTALFFFVLYVVIQKDLRRAAQEIARTKAR